MLNRLLKMLRKICAFCFVFGGGREGNQHYILMLYLSSHFFFFTDQGGGIALELSREGRLGV